MLIAKFLVYLRVQPWLQEKPDLSEYQTIRKKIKSLKSRLRHKLADKQDLEEEGEREKEVGDDGEKEEVKLIEHQLEKIRGELHAAFVDEDGILVRTCYYRHGNGKHSDSVRKFVLKYRIL